MDGLKLVKVNPNKNVVALVMAGLKAKDGYFPCKALKIPDNICPCLDVRERAECCCRLYVEKGAVEC